jgi:hypothetical protein
MKESSTSQQYVSNGIRDYRSTGTADGLIASDEVVEERTLLADSSEQKVRKSAPKSPGADVREQCGLLARQARDAFREACNSQEPDQTDACFASVLHSITNLWEFARLRDRPFRDLLAALDAALRHRVMREFGPTQQDALQIAFADLPRWHLDDETVACHLTRFVECDVDLLGPITSPSNKRFRITFDEVGDN